MENIKFAEVADSITIRVTLCAWYKVSEYSVEQSFEYRYSLLTYSVEQVKSDAYTAISTFKRENWNFDDRRGETVLVNAEIYWVCDNELVELFSVSEKLAPLSSGNLALP